MRAVAILLLLFQGALFGQPVGIDRSFLTVMVVPYTAPDESVRAVIEKSEVCRAVLGQTNRIFQERGYRTKDYMAVLRLPNVAPDAADLERTEIREAIKNAVVDIVVYVEIHLRELSEGDRQIHLQLQAIDQYSAENYADNISVESTRRRYSDFTQAVREFQLVRQLQEFADQLDRKLLDILENGRTITVKVSIKPGSKVLFGSHVADSERDLGGEIEYWLRERSQKIYPASNAPDYMQVECKVPVLDANQRTVTPYRIRTELKKYLESLQVSGQPLKVSDVTINAVIEMMLE